MNRRLFIAGTVVVLGLITVLIAGLASGPKVVQRGVPIPGSPGTMDVIKFRERSGFHAFHRGFRTTSEAKLPRLPRTNAAWSKIDDQLMRQTRRAISEFGAQVTWAELWAGLKASNDVLDWQQRISWEADWISPQLVSLHCTHWEYTGGAHGNSGFGALNVLWEGNSLRELPLTVFFRTNTRWQAVLAAKAEEFINRKKRESWGNDFSEDLAAKVEPNEMTEIVFTVQPAGFKLRFAPYEKGSYVEGSFEPLVPYAEILHLLDTNGPARWLPCFPETR